jgi:hypothetical protein
MSNDIRQAKRTLPLPTLMHQLGLGEHAKRSARCPFHGDQHNSFSVWKNGAGLWFWKCHTGCGEGGEINLLEVSQHLSRSEATKLFLKMADANGATPPPSKSGSILSLDWRASVEALTEKHIERLAKWRSYSIEFCRWLKENGFVVTL